MALPAFTFVFTFMPLLLSRLKLVSTTRDPCLSAPNGAAGLYLRFHVHAFSPFWFELLPTFFKPTLASAQSPQTALPAFTFVFTFIPFLLSGLNCSQRFFQPPCGSCLGAPGCAACLYFRFHVHAHSPFSFSCPTMALRARL